MAETLSDVFETDIVPALKVMNQAVDSVGGGLVCDRVGMEHHPRLLLSGRHEPTGDLFEFFAWDAPARDAGAESWMKFAKEFEKQFNDLSGEMWEESGLEEFLDERDESSGD